MKTIRQLTRLVTQAGGVLEEDEGLSDTRILQACAPDGKLWAGSDLQCLLVYWQRGSSLYAQEVNEDAYRDVAERVSHGLRDMTAEEREEHAVD